ncbi:MAG: UDP-N-acetylmuramate--L-alanine ligase [Bacteroidota bacterium]
MINTDNIKNVYFLGIGGIGMSALARFFKAKGAVVSGYDRTPSPLTRNLEREGMQIHYEDRPDLIPKNADMVVVTPAIPHSLKEFQHVKSAQTPLLKRAEVLGMISRQNKTIAVAGTHGKTSVTALVTHLLHQSGINVTAFVGGILKNYQSNCVIADNPEYVIIEADEYDRSFLQLTPDIAVITSIDADHLDIYGDRSSLQQAFQSFLEGLKYGGQAFAEYKAASKLQIPTISYGLETDAQIRITNNHISGGFQKFNYQNQNTKINDLQIHLPGEYNLKNAAAAITIALSCGANDTDIRNALASFEGVERRFDIVYRDDKHVYIDDYAHHPEEIRAFIEAVKVLFPDKPITGAFQPHLYSRTADFADGFAKSLQMLDKVILLPVYPAREEPIPGVSSRLILEKMNHSGKYLVEKNEFLDTIKSLQPEIFVTMGAGDIDRFVEPVKACFEAKNA